MFREIDFEGGELEIIRKRYSIILRPVRPTWDSFAKIEKTPAFTAGGRSLFCLFRRQLTLYTLAVAPQKKVRDSASDGEWRQRQDKEIYFAASSISVATSWG